MHGRISLLTAAIVLLCGGIPESRAANPAKSPASALSAAAADVATVRDRLVRSVLPTRTQDKEHLRKLATQHATAQANDGSWPDLDYAGKQRGQWAPADHLQRLLVIAKAARLARDAGNPDPQLVSAIHRALKWWTDHDYQNPNWWWNQIGVPQLIGEAACLVDEQLSDDERAWAIKTLARSAWQKWTGANLAWGVTNQITRGCLERSPETVADGYARLYQEVRVVSPKEEGVQRDFSFHQHGPQFYNGGYGLFYGNDIPRFISFAAGTAFQVPEDRMAMISSYLLDGQQWMTRGNVFDYSALGRVIVRRGTVAVPGDWTLGPISPTGAAYSLGNAVRLMSEIPSPRQNELESFARRLAGEANAPERVGNKHFWCSDYMSHRRLNYLASVKMFSTRILNGEIVNSEGRKSHHLSDGANFLYLTGNEYKDIFPVWDWQKVPGTTVELLENMDSIEQPRAVGTLGKTSFVGGVSDGTYGACAMDLVRGKLSVRKAWFFFDNAYTCLGSGISVSENRPVVTSVNQAHLAGDVRAASSESVLPIGCHDLDNARWVHHANVGYVFAAGSHVRLANTNRSGRWSDFGGGSSDPVTLPVFDLWIDHGSSCRDASYEYVVLPGATPDQTAAWSANPRAKVLLNTRALQAVFDHQSQTLEAVFWNPGEIDSPIGRVTVDRACMAIVRDTGSGRQVTLSNPENSPLTVRIKVGDQSATIKLPDGDAAGSSVTRQLR